MISVSHIYPNANPPHYSGMDIHTIRRIKLKQAIDTYAGGVKAKLARDTGTNPDYISQILSRSSRGEVGTRLARRIEDAYGLPNGWMDRLYDGALDPNEEALIEAIFVLVKDDPDEVKRLLKRLHDKKKR